MINHNSLIIQVKVILGCAEDVEYDEEWDDMRRMFAPVIEVFQVSKSQLGCKLLILTCPNSECGEMDTHQASG